MQSITYNATQSWGSPIYVIYNDVIGNPIFDQPTNVYGHPKGYTALYHHTGLEYTVADLRTSFEIRPNPTRSL